MDPESEERADRLVAPPDFPLQVTSPPSNPDESLHVLSLEGSTDAETWAPVQFPETSSQTFRPPDGSQTGFNLPPLQSSQATPLWYPAPAASPDRLPESVQGASPYDRDTHPYIYHEASPEGTGVPRTQSRYEPQESIRPQVLPPPPQAAQPFRIPQYIPRPPVTTQSAAPQAYQIPAPQGNLPQQPQGQYQQQQAQYNSAPPRYNLSYEQNAPPQQAYPVYQAAPPAAVQQPLNPPQQQPPASQPPPVQPNEYAQPQRRFSQEQRAFRPVRPSSLSSDDVIDEKLSGDDEAASEQEVDPLARVYVEDGNIRRSFITPETLRDYLDIYPEADNDRACRVFRYGPACSARLLMPLFERLDFGRYSQYPYGMLGNYSISDAWGSGSCLCEDCLNGKSCGQYVLHKNLQYYILTQAPDVDQRFPAPSIETTHKITTMCFGICKYEFRLANWNLQLFRSRSRTSTTTLFANNAIVYQNLYNRVKVRSSALEYVFQEIEFILEHWAQVLFVCAHFLAYFRMQVLEERLETDRTIVRTLVSAAQHWEAFRTTLKIQLTRVEFLRNVNGDPRWTEDCDDQFGTMLKADNLVQRLESIELRIMTELVQETDALIQRVTNLISIDEGYRSRDQNASVRRLTWITFIFLPLLFTSALFSMQIDLLEAAAPWRSYVYACLILTAVVLLGWATLRFRRRLKRVLAALFLIVVVVIGHLLKRPPNLLDLQDERSNVDLEQQTRGAGEEAPTLLSWAASSGNLGAIKTLLDEVDGGSLSKDTKGTALILAIQNGHVKAAQLLLSHKASVTVADHEGATSLHWAAKAGLNELCQELMRAGGSPSGRDNSGATPVDWAVEAGQVVTANLLLTGQKRLGRADTMNLHSIHSAAAAGDLIQVKDLAKKLDSFEVRDKDGRTVLMHGIIGGHMEVVAWLLGEKRSNMFAVDKEGTTPLHSAVRCGWLDIARLLIDKGADVEARDIHSYRPIHYVSGGRARDMIALLREHGAYITARGGAKMTLLHISALRGSAGYAALRAMVDEGSDLYDRDEAGQTALHTAAAWGNLTCTQLLVGASHDLMGCRDSEGYTPLMLAAKAGAIEVLKYLLDQGARHDLFDSSGWSLSDLAVSWGNYEVIALLRNHGARFVPTKDENEENRHPVWDLIRSGKGTETLEQLLGGDVSVNYTWKSISLLQCALEVANESVVSCLLARGASDVHRDDHGWNILHSAIYGGDMRCLLHVLTTSVDTGAEDEQGWTPLDLAIFYGHEDMVERLDPEGSAKDKTFVWPWGGRNDNWFSYAASDVQKDDMEIFEAPGDYPSKK